MTARYFCVKAKETLGRKQYEVEGVFQNGGGMGIPFFFMVLPYHASFQTVADRYGERLIEEVTRILGDPTGGPSVVKGGACGGEVGSLADELDLHGAMMSVVWDGDSFERDIFIEKFKNSLYVYRKDQREE